MLIEISYNKLYENSFGYSHRAYFYISFIEFFQAMLSVQYQMALPLIALFYLVVTVFRDEIKRGYLFLYKDISKKKIFNAKIQSLGVVYLIYLLSLFLFCMFVYYVRLVQFDYTSKTFPSWGR